MSNPGGINHSSYNPFAVLILFGGVFVLNLLYRAWRSRIHHGSYEFSGDAGKLILKSDLGQFVFDKGGRYLEASYIDNRKVKLSFDDIRNIEVITEDNEAMMKEFCLEGFSIFIDTNPKYRDMVQRYSIVAVTKEFKRYPLVVMTQYLIKDFMNFAVDLQLDILAMMNLYTPINLYSQNIYEKFKEFLGKEFRFDRE
jgi:hypothetical protein